MQIFQRSYPQQWIQTKLSLKHVVFLVLLELRLVFKALVCLFLFFQEYETKSGRAGPGNPTSPRKSVRKNLDFEPLSTTALILEDRPAYVNTHTHTHSLWCSVCELIPHFILPPTRGVYHQTIKSRLQSPSLFHSFFISFSSLCHWTPFSIVPALSAFLRLCLFEGEREVLLKI